MVVYLTMGIAVLPLVWVLWVLIQKGLPVILSADWWVYDMAGQLSNIPGGGISHAIIGTLVQALVTTLISVPIGVLVAIYLVESPAVDSGAHHHLVDIHRYPTSPHCSSTPCGSACSGSSVPGSRCPWRWCC